MSWSRFIQELSRVKDETSRRLGLKENWEGLTGGCEVRYDNGGEDDVRDGRGGECDSDNGEYVKGRRERKATEQDTPKRPASEALKIKAVCCDSRLDYKLFATFNKDSRSIFSFLTSADISRFPISIITANPSNVS